MINFFAMYIKKRTKTSFLYEGWHIWYAIVYHECVNTLLSIFQLPCTCHQPHHVGPHPGLFKAKHYDPANSNEHVLIPRHYFDMMLDLFKQ